MLPALWIAGHRAFAVSLSGVGERIHVPQRSVGLQTHIADVVNAIEAEELVHAILVGHSYGGIVITGVADRLADRLGSLVYLDAVLPQSGESWSSGHSAEVRAARRLSIAEQGFLPPPDPAVFGLDGADRDWVARRQTGHPGGVYDEPLAFDTQRLAKLPRTFISCTKPALATIDMSRERARTAPGWRFVELATGHDPMISAPDLLAAELLRAA